MQQVWKKITENTLFRIFSFISCLLYIATAIYFFWAINGIKADLNNKQFLAEQLISILPNLPSDKIASSYSGNDTTAYQVTVQVSGDDIGLSSNYDLMTAQNLMQAQYDSFSDFITWFVGLFATIMISIPIFNYWLTNKYIVKDLQKTIEEARGAGEDAKGLANKLETKIESLNKRLLDFEKNTGEHFNKYDGILDQTLLAENQKDYLASDGPTNNNVLSAGLPDNIIIPDLKEHDYEK